MSTNNNSIHINLEGNGVISIINDGDYGQYYAARGKLEGVKARAVDSHVYFSVINQSLFSESEEHRISFEKIYASLYEGHRKSKDCFVDVSILEFGPLSESEDMRKRIYYCTRCAIEGIAMIEYEDYVHFTVVITHFFDAHDIMDECIHTLKTTSGVNSETLTNNICPT